MNNKIIGMIVPTMDNSFFSSLAVQVEKFMAVKGYQTILANCENDADKEKDYLSRMALLGVDGLICVSGLSEFPEGLIPGNMPLVWVDRVPDSKRKIPWVANDDARAMEMAVDHLVERGCRNILLLPGFLAEKQESPRVRGYKAALEKHGIEFREEYVLNRKGKKSSEEETGCLIRQLFAKDDSVDGVITSSDRAAFGAITALQSIGYFVPEDVRLISFDNSTYSMMASPSITSLNRKTDILADKACNLLEGMIKGKQDLPSEIIVPVSIDMRDSTR